MLKRTFLCFLVGLGFFGVAFGVVGVLGLEGAVVILRGVGFGGSMISLCPIGFACVLVLAVFSGIPMGFASTGAAFFGRAGARPLIGANFFFAGLDINEVFI